MIKYVSLLLLFSSEVFSQGPVDGFFKGRGNLDLALSGAYQHSEIFYAGFTAINYPRTLNSVSLFAEYGIGNNFDVIVNVPFINAQFQDAAIFLKYRLPLKSNYNYLPLSVVPAIGMSFPISKYMTETTLSIGQRAIQIQPKLVLQYNLKHGFFIQAQGGYNYTLDPVPSSIPASVKIGFSSRPLKKIKGNIYMDAWFDYQKGLGDKEWLTDPVSTFRELYVTYSKMGGVIYYGLKPTNSKRHPRTSNSRMGFFINGSYILSGINLGKSFTIGAGVVFKFDILRSMSEKPGYKPPFDP
jgi:hypothetical protein